MSEQVLLTVPEVMARLRVGRHTVYQLIRANRLASVSIGRSRRIPASAVDRMVSELVEAGGA